MVAVDISGRHVVEGRYIMVCAAVAVRISPENIEKTFGMNLVPCAALSIGLDVIIELIEKAIEGFSGTVVVEKGDLYNLEQWRAESILGRELKYPESLGEKRAIELAHHASFAGSKLLAKAGSSSAEFED
ncbi:MAG: DUF2209 family protein [Methanotrichaceae archaeon]